jgi:outer membrane protein OmpA-like peptidoglycan-associated protein
MGRVGWTLLFSLVALGARAQDRDGDEVPDAMDLCPDAAEHDAPLFPRDGCPDVDADRDLVVDDYDVCPGAAETQNGFEDADGCPDLEGAAVRELAERLHFAVADHVLVPAASAVVARLASFLRAHTEIARVEIVGHADERSNDEANLALSQRRADAVREALVAAGIAPDRVTAVGAGTLPGAGAVTETENRRCDIRVTLDRDPRDRVDLDAMRGAWVGAALAVLGIGAGVRDSWVELGAHAAAWAGPARARLACHAARVIDDRFVLVCNGADRDATLVWRATSGDRAIGFLEVRAGTAIHREAWAARRVDTFDRMTVVRMITAHRFDIQACYQRELDRDGTLAGRVEIAMTVQPGGQTVDVQVLPPGPDAPATPAVGVCVAQVLEGLVFSSGPYDGPATFTFPFVFEPQH